MGAIAGLRAAVAPASVSWAVRWKWMSLNDAFSRFFFGSTLDAYEWTGVAIIELVIHKLPHTPLRKEPFLFLVRVIFGGTAGAALCEPAVLGFALGATGALGGAFASRTARRWAAKRFKVSDFVVALVHDTVAIGGAFFLVSLL